MTACLRCAISRLARSAPYSTVLLRNSEVSGVFRYLGPSSSASSLRAPNAITSPDRSRMGHISRPRNQSSGPRRPSRARPAVIRSVSVKPRPRRCLVRSSQAFGELETALGQERAGGFGAGRTQLLGVELGGGPVRVDQPAPLALLLTRDVATLLVTQVDAGPAGQPLDRLDEAEPVDLLHELDRVAALGAAEAVEKPARGGDVKRGCFLLVKRAEPLERAATRVLQLEVLAHHLVDR